MRLPAFPSLLFATTIAVGQSSITITAPQLSPEDANGHLLSKADPIYPPIAKAAHVTGTVVLQYEINPQGHVGTVKIISGPPMLRGAAIEAVKKWTYTPFTKDGQAASVSTTATFPFDLGSKPDTKDLATAQAYFPLQDKCHASFRSSDATSFDPQPCVAAAETAEQFAPDARYIERRGAYVYATSALLRAQHPKDALPWAEKAVAVVKQGQDDGSGSSAAYGVLGQAKAATGDLPGSDQDLTTAEEFQRKALDSPAGKELSKEYTHVLKGLLTFHARVLDAMGKSSEAQTKLTEAQKL